MHKVKINNITHITTLNNQSLLEEMESSGLEVEYNCRDGHCGACRCELVSGEVEYIGFAMAFIQPNEILPCICRAKTALKLDKVNYRLKSKRA